MQNKTEAGHRPIPQNKDDIDSRSNEEQDDKGDDTTHNKKETKNANLKKHGNQPGSGGND